MIEDRRQPGRQLSMRVVDSVESAMRAILPAGGQRLAYRAGYLALRPYWKIASPRSVGTKVVVRFGDEVLLLKHSYARRRVWDLPGGFVQADERAVDAVCRELDEELGVAPRSVRCISRQLGAGENKNETLLTFVAELEGRDVTPSPVEIDEARWFPVGDLPEQATPLVRRMVARASWESPMHSELPTR
ncbi:MAG: NUDIX hydrolase [Baekduia sp.]